MRVTGIHGFDHRQAGSFGLLLGLAASLLSAGCGGRHAEAGKPATAAIHAPPPEFEMGKMPETASAKPEAWDAGAPPKAAPPEPVKKRKEMQPSFSNDKGVSTIVGTHGALFRVAGATLRIPRDALKDGKDIRFAPSRTAPAKEAPARLGPAFDLGPALASAGPPYELTLPLPADAGDVVLVIVVRSKTKEGKPKIDVTLLAPKSVDASTHEALFELAALPEGDVCLAKRPPGWTASPEPGPAPSTAAPGAAPSPAPSAAAPSAAPAAP
jgi:hypothetical protein